VAGAGLGRGGGFVLGHRVLESEFKPTLSSIDALVNALDKAATVVRYAVVTLARWRSPDDTRSMTLVRRWEPVSVEFDNSFEVPLPPAEAWPVLMDIKRIAPCMPGAELTEVVDDKTYKGKIGVRLGPVALTFAGTVRFEEIDNANHRARVKAQGTDAKGRGGANAGFFWASLSQSSHVFCASSALGASQSF